MKDRRKKSRGTKDRREHTRSFVEHTVFFRPLEEPEAPATAAPTVNAGDGGLCLSVSKAMAVGLELALEVHVGEGKPEINASGRVAWCHKVDEDQYHVGIEFVLVGCPSTAAFLQSSPDFIWTFR